MDREDQDTIKTTEILKTQALNMAMHCVRNTVLEDYHAGIVPKSKTGDYTDVKVITPYGEIPWKELSRISNEEIKTLNKEVVNKIYTFLEIIFIPKYSEHQDFLFKMCSMYFPIIGMNRN